MLWLLNILDILVALNLIGLQFGLFQSIAIVSITYLIIKGLIFIADPFSILDIGIAVYIIVLLSGIKTFLTWICVLYLFYKVAISLMQ